MPFPTSIDGTILIATRTAPEQSIAPVRDSYRDWLVSKDAALIKATPLGFWFRVDLFRSRRKHSVLNFVDSGQIDVVADGPHLKASYRLQCTESLMIVSLVAAFMFIAAWIGTQNLPFALAAGSGTITWLFGMNYLTFYLRLSHALKRIARDNAN